MTAVPVGIAVHKIMALPGMTPRLLRTKPGRESMTVYARDGYEDIGLGDVSAVAFLDVIEQSGLRGRGGAAFPLATKARAVRTLGEYRSTQPVVVANGEEGEPGIRQGPMAALQPPPPGPGRTPAGGGRRGRE